MKKRILTLLLTLVLLVSILPMTAHADTRVFFGTLEDGLDFEIYLESGTGRVYALVRDCDNDVAEIVIPADIEGAPVAIISFLFDRTFSNVLRVSIPSGVITIEESFRNCPNLTDIHVDENNPYYSSDDRGVLFNKEKTELISAPRGITGSYTIPDGVTTIHTGFSVNYNSDALDFNSNAFYGCTGLTSITIPSSVTCLSGRVFGGCSNLTSIYFEGDAPVGHSGVAHSIFYGVTATAYYPGDNATWTDDVMKAYGGNITWVPQGSTPHTHEYTAAITAPTCTIQGYTTYTCSCGDTYVADYVDALGHDYADGSCTRCGEADPDYVKPVENPFTDVEEGRFYYEPVLWAVDNGITYGLTDTEFGTEESCKRSQVVTFLWRAAGSPAPKSSANPFVDVKKGSFYEKAVLWAVENGITVGTDSTHFDPDAPCTRSAVVTFLWRAAGKPAASGTTPFKDVPPTSWYAQPVLWALKNGITYGMTDTEFGTEGICTRAQVVTFLYRVYN